MKKPGIGRRLADRLTAAVVIGALKLIRHLPERLLWHGAVFAGNVGYRLRGARRERARRNLRRVVGWMAANQVGEERFRRAATDRRALEALVRSVFCHSAHYYVELARVSRFSAEYLEAHLVNDTPAEVAAALSERRALILVGLHFGTIELPGYIAVHRVGEVVAPVETLANERIQSYLVRVRRPNGIRLVNLEESARELLATLRRNEPIGLIADRDITGAGLEVQLFGATARIPAGPALLSNETGAPIYVAGVHRTGLGRYRGNLRPLPAPKGESRRERSRSIAQEEAVLFEKIIAEAPDQWLAVFHPIWPDLEQAAASEAAPLPAAASESGRSPSGGSR
jgi:lauroyl/myristoyl acyltransferase